LDDRQAPPGNGRALRDQVGARVRLVEIPQAGHFLVLEQPQAVAEAVIAFLREH
jgi:pimeloyl-ACP methyl ester carboxylesterase